MDNDIVIKASGVSKKFSRNLKSLMKYGFYDIGKSMLGLNVDSSKLRRDEFFAVDDVSFELRRGETLGIIGANGSGKSTLLKMLNGIYMPDKGTIEIKGKVGALIEVGAGFHPLLTGRENIYVNGAILGMSKKEIDEKFDDIVAFADIGDFLDSPVKNYSSGMFVRLGFAIAIHCDPDILLVDEILAVGDEAFHTKCFNKLGELLTNKVSIILVSHDMNNIYRIANNCMLLQKGKLLFNGATNKAINEYYRLQENFLSHQQLPESEDEHKLFLKNIIISDDDGKKKTIFKTGEKIHIYCEFEMKKKILNPMIHLSIYRDTYHGYNTKYDNFDIHSLDNNTIIELFISYCSLGTGIYSIGICVWDQNFRGVHYWNWNAALLQIESDVPMMGRFICDHKWQLHNKK